MNDTLATLQQTPTLAAPCASYPWSDALIATSGESTLREYLRILGHVSIHAHYDSQMAFLDRVDKISPDIPVCIAISPYGPAIEPDLGHGVKRPVWQSDEDTLKAIRDNQLLLEKWAKRTAGREVTILVDFERWSLDGISADLLPKASAALRNRWNFLLNQLDHNFSDYRLIIYGWGDHWFYCRGDAGDGWKFDSGEWRAIAYWPSDLKTNSEQGPIWYYGATLLGRIWTELRAHRSNAYGSWPHVSLTGQWPLRGQWTAGVAWWNRDMIEFGRLVARWGAHPVFWGRIGSPDFDGQLPLFVEGFNGG